MATALLFPNLSGTGTDDGAYHARSTRHLKSKNTIAGQEAINEAVLGAHAHLQLDSARTTTVVGLIGSTARGKTELANSLAESPVAWATGAGAGTGHHTAVHMLHLPERDVIQLHLDGPCDCPVSLGFADKMVEMAASGTLHQWLAETDQTYFKALLFMFLSCHVIVVCQDGPRVDLRTLQMLRLLQHTKKAVGPAISSHMYGNAREAKDAPRPLLPGRIVPSVLFVFRVPPAILEGAAGGGAQHQKRGGAESSPAVKLQQSLEKQLSYLLRKLKVTEGPYDAQARLFHTNTNSSSSPTAFVLAEASSNDVMAAFDDIFGDAVAGGSMLPFSGIRRFGSGTGGGVDGPDDQFWASLVGEETSSSWNDDAAATAADDNAPWQHNQQGVVGLRSCIRAHIAEAAARSAAGGSAARAGRGGNNTNTNTNTNATSSGGGGGGGDKEPPAAKGAGTARPQPTSAEWFVNVLALHDILFVAGGGRGERLQPVWGKNLRYQKKASGGNGKVAIAMRQLARIGGQQATQTPSRFSEQICRLALPHARQAYTTDLPEFYTRARHEQQMRKVRAAFRSKTLGAARPAHEHQLEAECAAIWAGGRQLCDGQSLSGCHCILKRHGPDVRHTSGVRFRRACSCGKVVTLVEDAFEPADANGRFERCCRQAPGYLHLPGADWSLHRLGSAAHYPAWGFLLDGFVAGRNRLAMWPGAGGAGGAAAADQSGGTSSASNRLMFAPLVQRVPPPPARGTLLSLGLGSILSALADSSVAASAAATAESAKSEPAAPGGGGGGGGGGG
eukprot:SAG22_NODE_2388_length_2626_cov_3.707163_1_plen_787_part_10